ncbi:MAG: hypothetical protein R2726_13470 [Acidimicrobiales bacterium]
MDDVTVSISTTADFAPSERLRAALEAVIAAYDDQVAGDDEVSGFAVGGLQIGSLGATLGTPAASGWRDGCWGYDVKSKSCGWYQYGGESCVGFGW